MKYTIRDLVGSLVAAPESDYVRVTADWISRGDPGGDAPDLTGNPVIDALVAAAVAQLSRINAVPVPTWTHEPARALTSLWHPSPPQFFSWSLAHAPAEFLARGLVIEQDSLESV